MKIIKHTRDIFFLNRHFLIIAAISLFFANNISAQMPSGYEQIDANGWKVFGSKEFLGSDIHNSVLKTLNENLDEISSNVSSNSLIILKTIPIIIEFNLKGKLWYPIDYHPSGKWLERNGFNPQWESSVVISNANDFLSTIAAKPGSLASSLADGYNHRKYKYHLSGFKPACEKLKKNEKMIAFLEGENVSFTDSTDERRLFNQLSAIYLVPKGKNFTRDDLKTFNEDAYLFMKETWGP